MAMQMQRAFNRKFLSKMKAVISSAGYYDADNIWVEGVPTEKVIWGVIQAGNKFSRFEEGIAMLNTDGGIRYSDYRSLYVTHKYSLEIQDKVEYLGILYNILQESDEVTYGFHSYLLEKAKVKEA